MKRWGIACGLLSMALLSGCDAPQEDEHAAQEVADSVAAEAKARPLVTVEPVRIVSAYIALAQAPRATQVLLLGEGASAYREFFTHAKVACEAEPNAADIVFACGAQGLEILQKHIQSGELRAGSLLVGCVDVRRMAVEKFQQLLASFPGEGVQLWMPGEFDWVLLGRVGSAAGPVVAEMMDVFMRPETFRDTVRAGCSSLPELFASYAGDRATIQEAFKAKLEGEVCPELFVTRAVPDFAELDFAAIDADIAAQVRETLRQGQVVRRVILEGDALSRAGDASGALARWRSAALRCPNDVMILERLERLKVAVETFTKLGREAGAAECFETMLALRPNDAEVAMRYGACLMRLGKRELAAKVFQKAQKLRKGLQR